MAKKTKDETVQRTVLEQSDNARFNEVVETWSKQFTDALVSKKKDPKDTELKAILYCDGGCIDNPGGAAGWGVHGYVYFEEEPKTGAGSKEPPTTEGYGDTRGKKVTVVKYLDGYGGIPHGTNNVAELDAAYHAIRLVNRIGVKRAIIYSDSKYVLMSLRDYALKWMQNGWVKSDGEPVANKEYWIRLTDEVALAKKENIEVQWRWIKGHSNNVGNDMADNHATRGLVCASKGSSVTDLRISDAQGYWKHDVERHPFLSSTNWYFITNGIPAFEKQNGFYTYYTGKHEDLDTLGKKISTVHFGVAQLEKPETGLEIIKDFHNRLDSRGFNDLIAGKLDNIFNPRIYADIEESQTAHLHKARGNYKNDVLAFDKTLLTEHVHPARQAWNALAEIQMLESYLQEIRKGDADHLVMTDITDLIYEAVDSKKKTQRKLKLENDASHLKADVLYDLGHGKKTANITLTIGVDIPKRTTLSALAHTEARLFVVTWKESTNAFRYGVLARSENEMVLWAAVYSNLRLVPPT